MRCGIGSWASVSENGCYVKVTETEEPVTTSGCLHVGFYESGWPCQVAIVLFRVCAIGLCLRLQRVSCVRRRAPRWQGQGRTPPGERGEGGSSCNPNAQGGEITRTGLLAIARLAVGGGFLLTGCAFGTKHVTLPQTATRAMPAMVARWRFR